jgi:hypothetical protein
LLRLTFAIAATLADWNGKTTEEFRGKLRTFGLPPKTAEAAPIHAPESSTASPD